MASHLPPGLSPDAVDALTELNSIITRLRNNTQQGQTTTTTSTTTTTTAGGAGGTQPPTGPTTGPVPPGVTGTTPLPISSSIPTPSGGGGGGGGPTSSLPTSAAPAPPLLSVKELPAATDHLKHKLQRARAAVRGLADVRRSIAQQEAELARLEARRRQQVGRLARTQEDGVEFVREEEQRRGGEEMGMGMGMEEVGVERMVE